MENGRGRCPHDPKLPFASTFTGMSLLRRSVCVCEDGDEQEQKNLVVSTNSQNINFNEINLSAVNALGSGSRLDLSLNNVAMSKQDNLV